MQSKGKRGRVTGRVLAKEIDPNLYVANYGTNEVYTIEKFNSSGVGTVFANSELNGPIDLAFDSAGNLYVGNYWNNTIERFNSSGVGTFFTSSGPSAPEGLAFDRAGNLYITTDYYTRITQINPNGAERIFASSGLSSPEGLAFDSSGNLYVANEGTGTSGNGYIEEFDTNGVGTVFASLGVADSPGLAFQPVPEPATWALLTLGVCTLLGGRHLRRGSS
jgi:sugar lactone lactonase YvrE